MGPFRWLDRLLGRDRPYRWIRTRHWKVEVYGLPERVPWPRTSPDPSAAGDIFPLETLARGIELYLADQRRGGGAAAPGAGPWRAFLEIRAREPELTAAIESGDLDGATRLLDAAERRAPDCPFVHLYRGFVARQLGRDGEALEAYGRATAAAPRARIAWTQLARSLEAAGRREAAVAAYRRALGLHAGDAAAMEGLARLGALVKVYADPRNPDSAAFIELEHYRRAVRAKIRELRSDAEELARLARFLLEEELVPELAAEAAEAALRLRPGHHAMRLVLGAALAAAGRIERAEVVLREYVERFPGDPWGHVKLAEACAARDPDAASRHTDRALELDPNNEPALARRFGPREAAAPAPAEREARLERFGRERRSWRAYVLASASARARADAPRAVELGAKAFDLNPDGADVLDEYSAALGDAGALERLAAIAKPRIAAGLRSRALAWNYAVALRRLGLGRAAVRVLERQLTGLPDPELRRRYEEEIDLWTGRAAASGVDLELNPAGTLRRAVLIARSESGDMVLPCGQPLPARRSFRVKLPPGDQGSARFGLEQGTAQGERSALDLGWFEIDGMAGPAEVTVVARTDRQIRVSARQGDRKLAVRWSLYRPLDALDGEEGEEEA